MRALQDRADLSPCRSRGRAGMRKAHVRAPWKPAAADVWSPVRVWHSSRFRNFFFLLLPSASPPRLFLSLAFILMRFQWTSSAYSAYCRWTSCGSSERNAATRASGERREHASCRAESTWFSFKIINLISRRPTEQRGRIKKFINANWNPRIRDCARADLFSSLTKLEFLIKILTLAIKRSS